MNREEFKKKVEEAFYVDGKDIEIHDPCNTYSAWKTVENPSFFWDIFDYRIVEKKEKKMDREEFNRRKKVEEAFYVDGKNIEIYDPHNTCSTWETVETPTFSWEVFDYRIAEDKKEKIFEWLLDNFDTILLSKNDDKYSKLGHIFIGKQRFTLVNDSRVYSCENIFDDFSSFIDLSLVKIRKIDIKEFEDYLFGN